MKTLKNSEYLAQQEPELYEMIRLRLIVDEPFRAFIEFIPLTFFSSIEKIAKGNKESLNFFKKVLEGALGAPFIMQFLKRQKKQSWLPVVK